MGALFGAIVLGFCVMLYGLTMATGYRGPGASSGPSTELVFTGILLMAIGVLGSAALQAHRRQRERVVRARERARRR